MLRIAAPPHSEPKVLLCGSPGGSEKRTACGTRKRSEESKDPCFSIPGSENQGGMAVQQSLRLAAPPHSEPKVLLCGSPGSVQIRTSFSMEVIVAIPFARWGAQPYVTHPFPYPETLAAAASACGSDGVVRHSHCVHPIHMAMKWRRMLDEDASLDMSQLARNQSVSRARVTQVMNLLALPQDVRAHLIGLQEPAAIRYFNEHKLRTVVACATPETQVRRFRELCRSFGQYAAI